MNYVVTTTWSHPAEMNKEEMATFQQTFSDNPDLLNIYWFEIDPTTHGSVSIFRDKAAYEAGLPRQQANRERTSTESGIRMTHEAHGACFAILRS